MYKRIIDYINNSKIRLFIFYFTIYLGIVFALNIVTPESFDIMKNSNSLLNLISIPCCLIYYKNSKNKNVFIFMLIYISIFIENSYIHVTNLDMKIILLLFIYRTMLLGLIINDENKVVKFLAKYPIRVFLITSIFNLVTIPINTWFFSHFSEEVNGNILKTLVILSYFIVIKLAIKVVKKKDFIENVLIIGILLMGVRLYLQFILKPNNIIYTIIPGDSILFFMTFSSILVAIFVQIIFTTTENEKLNLEKEIIADDMMKLKEIEDLRTSFFANLSHELKTPINIMYSGIQLLDVNTNNEEFLDVYDKYEPVLQQNCFRMIRLTNNLVDMTKINAGYMELEFEDVDIVRLVESLTMAVIDFIKNKNVHIIFDTFIEEHIIRCNVDSIERILLNLLSNAIKFSDDNGEITVLMDLVDDNVIIKVKDEGIGIPESERDNIFELFIQADMSLNRKQEGSGIGLSLVKSLVKLHGGEVYLEDVEVGTEVVVKLPDVRNNEDATGVNDLSDNIQYNFESKINIEFSDIYDIK